MSPAKPIDLGSDLRGLAYTKRDGVAFVHLDRAERGNSLTPPMMAMFAAVWADVRDDPAVRVAIVTAAGERHFSTGFDVDEAEGPDAGAVFDDAPLSEAVTWSPHQNGVWKPVICGVQGLVVGGGLHFVVDSDIVVASRNAKFMDAHVNVGMVGAIENIGLAKRLPLGSALRMTLMGRHYRMPAERAHQLGLVDELVEAPADVLPACEEMARAMLLNSPQAMELSKRAIWGSLEQGYRPSLEAGWELLKRQWSHPDFVEGPRAFGEKREPVWNPDPNARSDD